MLHVLIHTVDNSRLNIIFQIRTSRKLHTIDAVWLYTLDLELGAALCNTMVGVDIFTTRLQIILNK